jgi:aspartokinase/homoserine dehydrogenase 1
VTKSLCTKILKFSGTCLTASDSGIKKVIEIVEEERKTSDSIIIVSSAFNKTRERLKAACYLAANGDLSYKTVLEEVFSEHLELAQTLKEQNKNDALLCIEQIRVQLSDLLKGIGLVKDASAKLRDSVLACAEILAAQLLLTCIRQTIPSATYIDSRELIITNREFGRSHALLEKSKNKIQKYFSSKNQVVVVTGNLGLTEEREPTTFGKRGSDYTAAILANALGVKRIQLWAHVGGFMTADPSKVKKAFTLPSLNYDEALELVSFGSDILHPLALSLVRRESISLVINNPDSPQSSGTLISDTTQTSRIVTGVALIDSVSLIQLDAVGLNSVADLSKRVFDALLLSNISVQLITQGGSKTSICIAVSSNESLAAIKAIKDEFISELNAKDLSPIQIDSDLSIVAVVGENMRHAPGVSGRFFQTLGKNGINIVTISQGSSERSICAVIKRDDAAKALNAIHDTFFISDFKTVNIFLAGIGAIGSKLLEQISEQVEGLKAELKLDLQVIGVANSNKYLIDTEGLNLSNCVEVLKRQGTGYTNAVDYFAEIKHANLSNSVFVDCTASEEVASLYQEILSSSISVVTPNKLANAGSYQRYLDIHQTAEKSNVKFFYETNVGAGLPVIGTLNDLVISGDKVIRIEAVLSGTLSYIFNNFTQEINFSEIVRQAKSLGYTEPDPRMDLNGMDVARKLLILARDMGLELEAKDVTVESLVPKSCEKAANVEDFFLALEKENDFYSKKLKLAISEEKVLRYVGKISEGRATVSLTSVDKQHPFYDLSGADNIISFTTMRYLERPLVIKGPGAGVEVTAAGVLADIIRAASYLS